MLYKNIFILILLSLISFSCSSENNPVANSGKNTDIYPLQVGNKWKYLIINYDSNSNPTDSAYANYEIRNYYEYKGAKWFEMGTFNLFSHQSDGIWHMYVQQPEEVEPALIYKYPTYDGDTYFNYKVISMHKIVRIGTKYYITIQYRLNIFQGPFEYDDYYLCRGIGLVESRRVKKNSKGKDYVYYKKILLNYTIN